MNRSFGKRKLAMLLAEGLGSGFLTLVVMGVQHSTIGVPYFAGIAAAFAAAAMIFVFNGTSGAQLNPAITLALWSARRVKTTTAVVFIAMQLLGAWGAYYLFTYFINTKLNPAGTGFDWRILIAEAVGTFVLALAWSVAVYGRYTVGAKATVVGLGYILGMVIASAATIGLINPAVALADRTWVWGTYVLGPVVGALVGVNLYAYLFAGDAVVPTAAAARVSGGSAATASKVARPARSTKTTAKKAPAKRKTTRRK